MDLSRFIQRVSTHSRLKAAGLLFFFGLIRMGSFNTQPPEGGWSSFGRSLFIRFEVSTHSRLKAAGALNS